ncbi:hypothetical protein BX616_004083 [Lobosporangium transversale]|uniref:Uncharacterized protein n=1 Tax=Lobosporangium transversale TaxID=64571 RepID=A0A1Y2H161_9FUNG|nr:hypothetical protein BCR41DRAFT_344980 [Lobosporangium transversale]KAF9898396.1 hypothetical protein BX616_004083 [Lobosporangium transversale]ORZ28290.1 hypothetical protein BCR41DRAFT_344980 [Lobosporangium transversale]|eukprot:XP_021885975.1 hypothetical protein BCR41DRAFT_344980 [Lobosporangium transversale]
MSSTNNTISSSSAVSTSKKRTRDEVESTPNVNKVSSSTRSDPNEYRGRLVPFAPVSTDGVLSAYSKLFLDLNHCSIRGQSNPLPADYQDGPREWLTLEGHVARTHKGDVVKRETFTLFHLHEPSLFKQLEKHKLRLVSEEDWETAKKARATLQQQRRVTEAPVVYIGS